MITDYEKLYPCGNEELLTMFEQSCFNKSRTEEILREIPDVDAPILDKDGYPTTYLYEAQRYNSLEGVRLLLEHGADPNGYHPELISDCPLWDLQYGDEDADWEIRFKIAKLFFEYGADPDFAIDGEKLFYYLEYEVFNEAGKFAWEYQCRLYILMIAYGGGEKTLSAPMDLERLEEYDIIFTPHEDGYHIVGHLIDPEGNDIGIL